MDACASFAVRGTKALEARPRATTRERASPRPRDTRVCFTRTVSSGGHRADPLHMIRSRRRTLGYRSGHNPSCERHPTDRGWLRSEPRTPGRHENAPQAAMYTLSSAHRRVAVPPGHPSAASHSPAPKEQRRQACAREVRPLSSRPSSRSRRGQAGRPPGRPRRPHPWLPRQRAQW